MDVSSRIHRASAIAVLALSMLLSIGAARAQEMAPRESEPPAPLDDRAADEAGKGATGVRGTIVDARSSQPLGGVDVRVIRGGEGETVTDSRGEYFLRLRPGRYDVRISYDIYEPRRVRVVVTRGKPLALDVELEQSRDAIEVVFVKAAAETRTEAGALQIRKKATTVSDSLSAQEMSRAADSSAAGAVKRVVSATVVDGRYVLVRGLGGRYMTTLLNGVSLPSPEPDKQAVPLDLFPTSLLANLTVAKSYSARAPGTFAGGTLEIETNSYPEEFQLKLKASTGAVTTATAQEVYGYSGGSLGFLGFDDGTRSLPDSVPRDQPLRVGVGGLDAAAVEAIAEDFPNIWSTSKSTAYPNLSLGATVGDTRKVSGKRLGYLATASFSHKVSVRDAHVAKVRTAGDALEYREEMKSLRGKEGATLGGLANVGYELADGHDLSLFWLYTHTGESSTTLVSGVNETDSEEVNSTRLTFVDRYLNFVQTQGRHRLLQLDGGPFELRWQANLATTRRDEPDTRDLTYIVLPDGRLRFKNETGSGERFFSELQEQRLGAGLDLALPVSPFIFRTGAIAQRAERQFSARRFRLAFIGSDPAVLFEGPEEIFSPANIGESFLLGERTFMTDAYDAELNALGAYSEIEAGIGDRVRLIGGLRYEVADQELTPGSPFASGEVDDDDITRRTDNDFLPALSAVYALTDTMNLRAAYSYTLARPQFRELAKFLYVDYTRRRSVSGNPALVETRIHNGDLRWEWFASDREVFAGSLFWKQFVDPIEQVIVSASGGDVSFDNAAGATSIGAEVEGRMSLARISTALRDFRIQANVSLIRSSVELTDDQLMSQTSKERPLQGQSPYVVNTGVVYSNAPLGIDLNAFYNVFGRRIAEVGFDTLPDVYEKPFHRVDVTASKKLNHTMKLKLAATNILNSKVQLDQGGLEIFGHRPGAAFSASLEWSP